MDNLEEVEDLEILTPSNVQEEPQKPLQKPKIKKGEKPVTEDAVEEVAPTPKPKKERTPKQIEVTNRMREKMLENLKIRKQKQAEDAVIKKKELEEKIVKKAIAIKKKEIKRKAILEEISDDDETPIEVIKKIAKKIAVKTQPVQPEKELTIFDKYKFI